ncbi:MAG: hypothetical protein PHZ05_04645 [Pygmaiobacter massiliensis]|nr:hypothetical protein [Pygmaiobacter massiliensis]
MNNKKKLPLSQKVQHSLLAIVASLAVCLLFLLLFATGGRGEALKSFFILPLTTANGWSEMINAATTFTFIAIGVSVMYQCRQYSLITEGSFLLGACIASLFLLYNNTKPSSFLIVGALFMGAVSGMSAAWVPAQMHAKHGVNVTLSSAIMNFFILQVTTWLLERFMADPLQTETVSFSIPERMRLPVILHSPMVRVGTLFAIAAGIIAYLVLYRTRRGYEVRMVGASQNLATYVGLSSAGIVMFSQIFAGAMAGLGGAIQMMGIAPRYTWDGVFSNIGFAGIIVALLVNCNPAWVPLSALLFGYLTTGGLFLEQNTGISQGLGGLAQAMILLFIFAFRYISKKYPAGLPFMQKLVRHTTDTGEVEPK